jgi:3'-5' exoribonuclease
MNNPHVPAEVLETVATPVETESCIITSGTNHTPSDYWTSDQVAASMPPVMRIMSLSRTIGESGSLIINRASLYHARCSLQVEWVSQHTDTRLYRHGLVTIRHALTARSSNGALRIQRLLPADRPMPSVNLFETVPPRWVADRDLVARAAELWDALPRPLAFLMNAVLWDSHRFHRYAMGPASIVDHHNGWNGNLRHSIEVAEQARDLGMRSPLANLPLLIVAGLLHDAGKADEYRRDEQSGRFHLSDRGELIGHRDTLIEWLAVARETLREGMPEDLYLSLLHVINAAKAPAWVGLRDPRCIEAEILSVADRLSGSGEMHERCAPAGGGSGFGAANHRSGRRCYVTSRVERS